MAGIRMVNCEDCIIENNTIIDCDVGVELQGGANLQIMKNNFSGVQTAIKARNVEKLLADGNIQSTKQNSAAQEKKWLNTYAEAYSIKKMRGK